jgi:hypothetical protein
MAALAVIGGAQLRIAKIVIKEQSGPRTVFRVCLPGRTPNVFAMTDRDFMCHIYDRYGLRELAGGFGLATETIASSSMSGATPILPNERDRQVLESVLLHLVADPEFDMTRVTTNGAVIVLHMRTPEKTGLLMSPQIHSDIGSHELPSDVEEDLRRRNTPPNAKPETYDAVIAFYTNLTFAAGIVVADLTDKTRGRRSSGAFEEAHPKARGYARAYLPGYSKDGTRAVVRTGVGPSAHGAMVTALLEKRDGKWVVKWHHIAWYV